MQQPSNDGGDAADSLHKVDVPTALPAEVDAASSSAEVPIMATLVEEPVQPELPPAPKGPWGAPFGLSPEQPAVCVPRRFSVGTMMILVTAFAVLLGILKIAGVDPIVLGVVPMFLAGVGACQVLMFEGKDPRQALFVGGMIVAGVLTVITAIAVGYLNGPDAAAECVVGGIVLTALGGPLGYAAGCVVAAIFLVRKEPDDPASPPDETIEGSR